MKYVILGASAAGINGALTLRRLDKEAEIVLISKDERIYSRCIMHHYMEGKRALKELSFVEDNFTEKNRITWKRGKQAVRLDNANQMLYLEDGEGETYDKLLIAAGSHSFLPPIEGLEGAENFCGFHDLGDCEKVLACAEKAEHIVILGAGLVGVDVATGLLDRGKELALVDMKEHMLAVQLDEEAARVYQDEFTRRGVKQYYKTGAAKVIQNEEHRITKVVLTDQTVLDCDLLVIAAGVRANVDFLKGSGIETDRFGLVIDKQGRTNDPLVYGAGDVTGRDLIWPVAVKEGIVAASNMAGKSCEMTDFFYGKSWMNFFEVPTLSYGLHELPDDTYTLEQQQPGSAGYRKLIYKNGRLSGAILQGDLSYSGVLTLLIHGGIDPRMAENGLLNLDGAGQLVYTSGHRLSQGVWIRFI